MARNIEDIISHLPKQRRDKVNDEARKLALEMIQHAESLDDLRKALGQTQAEVAATLGIGQNAVSQLESRADLYLSTLSKYMEALGMRLEIALLTPEGERVELQDFRPWERAALAPVARSHKSLQKQRPASRKLGSS